LVTGAAGFIGTHLVAHLERVGAETRAVSRSASSARRGTVTFERADLSDPRVASELIGRVRPEIVFHLAGLALGARNRDLILRTFESNLRSTVNLLIAASESGDARVVLPGSLEEPEPPDAVASSPYAMSKWAASSYGRMFHALYGLDVTIARVFITYGPTHKDLHKLIPYVILSLLRGEAPKLARGRRPVDWIHVQDVVEGLIALALAEGTAGQTVDIGSGVLVPIRNLVEMIAEEFPKGPAPVFDASPERPFEQVRAADLGRTLAAIGWEPRIALAQGLKETIEWFRAEAPRLDQGG
jgi:nucleoside-diphosphate-sugar epimerase